MRTTSHCVGTASRNRATAIATAASLLAFAGAGSAVADDLVADGDSLQGSVATIHLGSICPGDSRTSTANQLVLQIRQANGGTSLANGAALAFAYDVQGTTYDDALTSSLPTGQSVPADWNSRAVGSLADVGSPNVTVATSSSDTPSDTYYEAKLDYSVLGSTNLKAIVNVRWNVLAETATECSPGDAIAPTNGVVTINDGARWTNSLSGAVSVDLSATDNVGIVKYRLAETQAGLDDAADVPVSSAASFSATDVAFTLTGTDGDPKQAWARLFDAAGGSVDANDNIGWDKTGPVVTDDSTANPPSGTKTSPGNAWYTSNVTVTFKAMDNLSGFLSPLINPHTFVKTTSGEGSAVTVGSGTVDDVAGNSSNAATSSAFRVDLYDPTLECEPAPTFTLGSTGNSVSATVTDTLLGSGPVTSPVSAAPDTSSIGSRTVSLTGYDNADREASLNCGYSVIYDWAGFFRPVDNLPTLNSVKAGSAVPVKFSLGGDQGLDIMAAGYPKSEVILCDSTAQVDGIEQTVTAGGSSLSYDASVGQYIYVWKTDRLWAGTCRQLVVKLDDGTVHRANFKLMK